MLVILFALIFAVLATAVLTPVVILLSHRLGLISIAATGAIDSTPARRPAPRGGGVAVALSTALTALIFFAYLSYQGLPMNAGVWAIAAVAAAIVTLIGLANDIVKLSGKLKLLSLIAVAGMIATTSIHLDPLGGRDVIVLGLGIAAIVVTVLLIVGTTVAVNFIDGLDGLAAGICAIAAASLLLVNFGAAQFDLAIISAALLGTLIAFLFFNHHPARVALGDSGSMFLGVTLAVLMIITTQRLGAVKGLLIPSTALAIPMMDAVLTLLRRSVVDRRSLFQGEKSHIHHRLLKTGIHPHHVVMILCGVTLLSTAVIAAGAHLGGWAWPSAGLLVLSLLTILFRSAGSVRAREMLKAVRRNRGVYLESLRYRRELELTRARFQSVRTIDQWWAEMSELARRLDCAGMSLRLLSRGGKESELNFVNPKCDIPESQGRSQGMTSTIPVPQRRRSQSLVLHVRVCPKASLESAGERLALITRVIANHGLDSLEATPNRLAESEQSTKAGLAPLESANEVKPDSVLYEDVKTKDDAFPLAIDLPSHKESIQTSVFAASMQGLVASHSAETDDVESGDVESVDVRSDRNASPPLDARQPRVAIIHDFLYTYAGAERVVEQMLSVYPDADIFSLFDFLPPEKRGFIRNKPVKTSFIQRLPFARTKHRMYLPLMPLAIEQLDVSGYDVVLSSSYLAAKGVITRPGQLHVCYCHTPARYAWDLQDQYLGTNNLASGIKSMLARVILHYIRTWDARSSNGVDHFIANSNYIGRRIEKCYRRTSTTIYPPIDVDQFHAAPKREEFYFTLGRLVPYKRVDLLVDAFNKMQGKQLVVVGDGPDLEKLRAKAGPNIKFMGFQSCAQIRNYLSLCKGFVFGGEEDFGIVLVEAQASGAPVIAYGAGGAKEIIIDGQTGVFFDQQSPASIIEAVNRFEKSTWDSDAIVRSARRFGVERFRDEIEQFVGSRWRSFIGQFQQTRKPPQSSGGNNPAVLLRQSSSRQSES